MANFCTQCGARFESQQRFCGECGAKLTDAPAAAPVSAQTASQAGPAIPSGERRSVAVLFADLTNFTGLSTQLDAEDLHAIVRDYTSKVSAAVHAYGGVVERYIGDSVMAVFGAPIAHGDDALRAVRAALMVQSEVMPELSRTCGAPLQASIGISFGEVMFSIGQPGHPEGVSVVGESVNLAARVQGQAGAGNVFITDALLESCGDRLQTQAQGQRALKGIPQPVTLHKVIELVDLADQPETQLIGRDLEVAQLRDAVTQCMTQGVGCAIHLQGEPGIGKSRLLRELQALGRQSAMRDHSSAYLDFGLEQTLTGIAAVVASLLGIAADQDVALRLLALQRAVDQGTLQLQDVPMAKDALHLPQDAAGHTLLDAMDSDKRRAMQRGFVLTLARQVAQQQAQLIVIEDAHWMPLSEQEDLLALCELALTSPLVIATTSRSTNDPLVERMSRLEPTDRVKILKIGPIDIQAARQIASGFDSAQAQWVESCINQADGNPLYLEQLLRHGVESRNNTMPASIHNVVLARLDQMQEVDREAAKCASVIGQRFNLNLLQHLLDNPSYDISPLERAIIVKSQQADWRFTHALLQAGAYSSLLRSTARALHCKAAEHYRHIDLILRAQHLERGQDSQAAQAYREAAFEQWAAHRYERTHELIAQGLAIASTDDDRVELKLLEGRTLHDQGRVPQARQCYQDALTLASTPSGQGRAWLGIAMCMRLSDDLDGALAALAQAQPLLEQSNQSAALSELHYLRGGLHFPRGELDACLHEHGLALQLALANASPFDEARALSGLGDAHYAGGRMKTALGYFDRCMKLCADHGFGRIEAANRFMVATVRMYMNELSPALNDALQSAALAHKVGHQRAEIVSRLTASWLYLQQGLVDGAHEQTTLGLALVEQLGAPRFRAFLLESVARIKLARGDHDGAINAIDEALALARSLNVMRFIGAWILATRALIVLDRAESQSNLAEGQALLDAGCVGHNYFWFYKHALEAALKHRDLAAVEAFALRFEQHTGKEPTPWDVLFIERARTLALLQQDPLHAAALAKKRELASAFEQVGHHEANFALLA